MSDRDNHWQAAEEFVTRKACGDDQTVKARDIPQSEQDFLIQWMSKVLYWFYVKRGLQRADAEDLAQTAISKIFHFGLEFDRRSDRAFRAWFFVVARSVLLTWYSFRRRDQSTSVDPSVLAAECLDYGLTVIDGDSEASLNDILLTAIEDLSEDDQEIIHLRRVENLSSKETAERLGISDAAARKRLGRAQERVKARLNAIQPELAAEQLRLLEKQNISPLLPSEQRRLQLLESFESLYRDLDLS